MGVMGRKLTMSQLDQSHKTLLLDIAKDSIHAGITNGRPLSVEIDKLPQILSQYRASFVTLQIQGQLRGCIGSLQAYRPLAVDIAENAFSAAFRDPRFPPLTNAEESQIHVHISVLSETSTMSFSSEEDLLSQLRPNIDGLVLEDGFHRGTFLPSVWEQLPTKESFLDHLKQKAGLPSGYWSDNIKIERYTVDDIE